MTEPGSGYFERNKSRVRLTITGPLPRARAVAADGEIRRAQLGAAFAVAAHFTLDGEPALVSMPTGSGKTAVMTLVPFLLGANRVLVVAPTRLLRDQLAEEFTYLRVLRDRGVFPGDVTGPRVAKAERRLADEQAWARLASDADVVIGTPHVLSPGSPGVASPPAGSFDLVLVDEGHHTAAPTYRALLDAVADAAVVLFTATPFRRDRHEVPADLVYAYRLQQALDDGVLVPVEFLPVDAAPTATAEERDRALAAEAVRLVRAPAHVAAESRIIARTSSVKHAKWLVGLYDELGAPMGLITAATSATAAARTLRKLRDGTLVGLVSVGALGEGFDFPTLKIAVYHRRHASLPATLQFLGRVTRLVPDAPPAVLLAIREEVTDETRELYAADAAWALLVPELADAAVESEAERRRFVRNFTPPPERSLSMSAIRPRKDVAVFKIRRPDEFDLRNPIAALAGGDVIYHGVDDTGRVAVIITEHLERPEWMTADTLDSYQYELHVVVKDHEDRYLFVRGARDSSVIALVEHMGEENPQLVDPLWLDRLMTALALAGYYSVGMRSARAAGGRLAAYRMMAGSNVGGAVLPSETRSYGTGHAIAQVHDPMITTSETIERGEVPRGRTTSIGVSYGRAKVFSPDLVHLLDFRKWCDRIADLVDKQASLDPSGLPGLSLRSPRTIERFPNDPYLAVIEPTLRGRGLVVRALSGDVSSPLDEFELAVYRRSDQELELHWPPFDEPQWIAVVHTSGVVEPQQDDYVVDDPSGDSVLLTQLLSDIPPTVFYADGSSTMGRVRFQPKDDYADLGGDVVTAWPFDKVDVRAETSPPRVGMTNIINHVIGQLSTNPDVEFVVNDDRAHEIADVIVIERPDTSGTRSITLVHCKFSSEDHIGARVGDLYEVLGQAGRCVKWLYAAHFARRLLHRLVTGSEVAHGDDAAVVELLTRWQSNPEPVRWKVAVVQPGLRASQINTATNIKIMLTDVLEWIAQHDAPFQVIAHA